MNAPTSAALRVLLRAFGRASVAEALQHAGSLEAVATALSPLDPKLGWVKLLEAAVSMLRGCRDDADFKALSLAIASTDRRAAFVVWSFWAQYLELTRWGICGGIGVKGQLAAGCTVSGPLAPFPAPGRRDEHEQLFDAVCTTALLGHAPLAALPGTIDLCDVFAGSDMALALCGVRPSALRWLGLAMDRGFGFSELPEIAPVFEEDAP